MKHCHVANGQGHFRRKIPKFSIGANVVTPISPRLQRDKFPPHIMVSAGVSFEGKGRVHFVEEKAKINANYDIDDFLPKLVEDAHALLGNNFVF